LLLLWPAAAAFADQPTWQFDGGQIFTDEDVTLQPGQTFNGDLGVFSGDLDMPADSTVNGDVFVANGDARVAGRVNGSLAVIDGNLDLASTGWVAGDVFGLGGKQVVAGNVRGSLSAVFGDMLLRSTAVVEGDLLVAPGSLEREAGARVLGEQVQDLTLPRIPAIPERPALPEVPRFTPPALPEVPQLTPPAVPRPIRPTTETFGQRVGHFVGRTFSAGLLSLLFLALGVLIVFVWPRATHKVADCISTIPAQSFGLGLLTLLIAAGLEALAAVLMVIIILIAAALIGTVILIPIGLLLMLLSTLVLLPVPIALAGGMVLGWVGLAELIGNRLLKALRAQDIRPLGATLVGLLITLSLAAMLWVLKPVCCAWPFVILLSSVGLGAVVHTRFGREGCQASSPAAAPEALPAEAMDDEAGQPDVPPAVNA
jgi:Polymer-forming cytoskeletal